MKKRILSVLLAAGMVAGLAVPALASVDEKAVKGFGEVGIFDVINQTEYPYINPVKVNADEITGNRAIAGATITVAFPTSQVDVDDQSYARDGETAGMYILKEVPVPTSTDGTWSIDTIPSGADMSKDMMIYAWQEEDGKERSKRVVVTIGSGKGSDFDKDDQGGGTDPELPLEYLDVTIPREFNWYVNQDTGANASGDKYVKSPIFYVTNNRTTLTNNGQEMKATVAVGLKSFEADSDTYTNNLVLNMIDKSTDSKAYGTLVAFANTFAQNADVNANPGSTGEKYVPANGAIAEIEQGESVAFGFEGLWKGTLASQKQTPGHTMILTFEVLDLK